MNNFSKQAFISICLLLVTGCSLFNGKVGTLTGQVTIGPLQPTHREGETEPTPSPELYAAWQIVIYTKDMQREIARANIGPEGNYQIVLPVSSYSVRAEPVRYNGGPGISDVYEVKIAEDEISYLNLDVDTGIR